MEVRTVARNVLPTSMRRPLSRAHHRFVFRRAMRRFLRAPEASVAPRGRVLSELIYGWGNEEWSAMDEYLAACIQNALVAKWSILECWSGVSHAIAGGECD